MKDLRWLVALATCAALLVGVLAVVALGDTSKAPVETDLGSAALAFGDDPARGVEVVAYRQNVARVGDATFSDGEVEGFIADPRIERALRVVDGVWPDSLRSELVQLSVFEEERYSLVGVVHRSQEAEGWILSLDAADLVDQQLVTETVVHELAHVHTLGPDVFAFSDGGCSDAPIPLGCPAAGSLLEDFARTFWPDGEPLSSEPGAFVTSYAATDVHEDLAEAFTALVFDWPVSSNDVLQAKLAFLTADDDLMALAAEITAVLN